jgi:pyruvate/2-oxoglutarate dehydrogenase complex dihydrolipoamide acyltransferase (E2) component
MLPNGNQSQIPIAANHEQKVPNIIPLTRIQKLIGERMAKSKLSKACFYLESKANVTELMALRPKLSKPLGIKITSNAFLIRALALAAQKYPIMVGKLLPCETEDKSLVEHGAKYLASDFTVGSLIKIADEINVGFPVHAPQGLMVSVIKNAHVKTLAQIAQLEKLLTEKARSNTLTLEQMQGQTIGLSNLGVYGIDSFFAIPAPVTSTILAVGNVVREVCPNGGQIAVHKMMNLSLAVDRIVSDEIYAAKFFNFIIDQLQNPQQLI